MDIKNLFTELSDTAVDEKVGIKVLKLTGDSGTSLFCAEIAPQKAVRPHYHEHGIEIYQIIEGNGEMKTGSRNNNNIEWNEPFKVSKGDAFTLPQGCVHTLKNTGDTPLHALFICDQEHLGADRFFI